MMPRRDVRPAAVAGSWYLSNPAQLEAAVDVHLAAVAPASQDLYPRALIAPHAGLIYSGPVAAHAYALVRGCQYSAVVLVGPSHFVAFQGVSIRPAVRGRLRSATRRLRKSWRSRSPNAHETSPNAPRHTVGSIRSKCSCHSSLDCCRTFLLCRS